jgi:1,5-anhydro-D-fructose reductase (1,5-anhydro-D-mannitol-forming)
MSNEFGLGFVGLGRAAGRLALAANRIPGVRITAVASTDAAKAQAFAAEHGSAKSYTSYDELLADQGVAGVVIASANAGHLPQVTRAAAAGKHVFCEKPVGRNGVEARAAVEACRRAGVTFGVGYHLRYHPLIRQARDAIAAGTLGEVRLLRGHFYVGRQYDRSGWRSEANASGGGALVSTGVHVIDAFHFLADDVTRDARMICDALPVEEVCSAVLSFGRGGAGMFDTSRVIPNAQGANDIEIFGERGRCVLTGVLGGWVPNGSGFIETDGGRTGLETDLSLNLYSEEIADWIGAVRDGREPLANGAAAISAANAMDALYANAAVCPMAAPVVA